ncbi:MCP methyltransferase, CheR-type, SAM-binding domain, C-terminal (plasmid) [Gemmatirosa kalamazoonensis]|uniref:protein-glutamate O-methyltransferase n=1 Tax=Gemmatirosa kalamazoonensis TaxID=861299 RepID=W0RV34_9BACT|nr:protein-glutamate O-methyltransferase CheR [Gemmatirosa kalamazoonensis]AHG93448.1 MCP methyltransferase, CheR-type, SAM-binding domain, C-terminal [Gemmatirosa kalamazoonensis]
MRDFDEGRRGGSGYGPEVLGISDSAFVLLRDLIAQRIGVHFGDDKRDLLADKLSDLLAARGMTSYLDYYFLLRYDAGADRHWAELTDRLSVPETFFWRQPEQFLALADVVAPRHFERRGSAPLRIWSAACCTGEEPLSIAIALAEAGLLHRRPVEIVASDASRAMVDRARAGLYGERSFRNLPVALRDRYFRREGAAWRVDPHLHGRIRWTTANLVAPEEVRPLARADVIFCRNVLIYFSDETITRVARQFAEGLADDGHLFLGASESLTRLETDFELADVAGAFAYVKGRVQRN